jgi:hypothetical protein
MSIYYRDQEIGLMEDCITDGSHLFALKWANQESDGRLLKSGTLGGDI